MNPEIPGWSPALERSFKEVLYRFLEEVQATKAALYLLASDGSYVLVTQYGFGKRDLLAAQHRPGEPLVELVRELRSVVRAFNDPTEIPDLLPYLEGAGTARLLVAPLFGASSILGFVDVRDKGRRREFGPDDLGKAARIAADLLDLIRRVHLYPELEEEPLPEPPSPGPSPPEAPPPDGIVLDEEALATLLRTAAGLAVSACGHTLAVTLASGGTAETVVFGPESPGAEEIEAIKTHQAQHLRRMGHPVGGGGEWAVTLREVPSAAGERVRGVIATSVLHQRRDWALVVSVVGEAVDRVEAQLAGLAEMVEHLAGECELRFARRLAVRRIVTGDAAAPEALVQHCEAVSRLAWSIARALGLSARDTEDAALAGYLHDVGMKEIATGSRYRNPSPGAEERQLYRRHVQAGEKLLAGLGLPRLAGVVRHHHERWDGTGYPDRLAGEAIPLLSRIVHAAEVFDVLVSSSSYRKPVPKERALAILRAAAGHQFDPRVLTALERVVA